MAKSFKKTSGTWYSQAAAQTWASQQPLQG